MCSVSALVVAGVLRITYIGCAEQEKACELLGYFYGTIGHMQCVRVLAHDQHQGRAEVRQNGARR